MKKTCNKSKRWLSLLLCVLLIVPMLALPAGAASVDDFKDVPSSAWYYDAVKYAVDKGIFAGMSDDAFEPQTALTRGMFVQTMANLATNYGDDTSIDNGYFTDIPSGVWYEKAANWAYANLLISGTAEKVFSAGVSITREQAATILYAYAMRSGGATDLVDLNSIQKYTDCSSISDWAMVAMIWATEKGVMTGVSEDTLQPKGTLTRAQAAQLFTNIQGVIDDEPYIYSYGYSDALGLEYEDTIDMTYGQLVENLGDPVKIGENSDQSYYAYIFEDYPDVAYCFDASKGFDAVAKTPLNDTYPEYIETTINSVMPDIVGMTYGAAIKHTEGGLYIYYESSYFPEILMGGSYVTNDYSCGILFNTTGTISAESAVYITRNTD